MEDGIEVFFSYAHKDEKLRVELEKQLINLKRQGLITCWYDQDIGAGKEWPHEIETHLNSARIILLLLSSDYLSSDFCDSVEIKQAVKRHEEGEARVIPIILRPVDWESTHLGKLQALPKFGKPVTSWPNRDEAFLDIARGIRTAVLEVTTLTNPVTFISATSLSPSAESSLLHRTLNQAETLQQAQIITQKPLSTEALKNNLRSEMNTIPSNTHIIEVATQTSERGGIKFTIEKDQNHANSIDIIIEDDTSTVFRKALPKDEDNIEGWYSRFSYLLYTDRKALDALLGAIPKLLRNPVPEYGRLTYLNLLHGVFKLLGLQKQVARDNTILGDNELYSQLEQFLFQFRSIQHFQHFETIFSFGEEESEEESYKLVTMQIPLNNFNKSLVEVCQIMLLELRQKQVQYLIENYIHFQASVTQSDKVTLQLFISFSKALVNLIKQQIPGLGTYKSHLPSICSFILEYGIEDVEEQKFYLEPILNSAEQVEEKSERLNNIIQHIEVSQEQGTDQFYSGEEGHRRLMHLISLISADYLRQYDFDSSLKFWRKAKSRDIVLWFFLDLHRWPFLFLFFQLVILSVPAFYAYQHWLTGQRCPLILGSPGQIIERICPPALNSSGPEFIIMLIWLIWYVFLVLLLLFIFTQIMRKRWLYSQLLLPRILGAAIVGLLFLMFNDQTWNFGILSSVFNWGLLTLLTYIFSFVFVFSDVQKTNEFIKGYSIAQVLKESGRIFLIALSETLFIVTVVSSLIFPAVISNIGSEVINYRFGIYAAISLLSFGFFPSLIILWTGLALFIGSIIQLFWQNRQMK